MTGSVQHSSDKNLSQTLTHLSRLKKAYVSIDGIFAFKKGRTKRKLNQIDRKNE